MRISDYFGAISILLISLTKLGGAGRNRTDDLYNAIVALSQLSYGPLPYLSMTFEEFENIKLDLVALFLYNSVNSPLFLAYFRQYRANLRKSNLRIAFTIV